MIALFILILFAASPTFAVTRDAVSSGQKTATGTTLTISHTVANTGGNRALYTLCGLRSNSITLTATQAGNAMTQVRYDPAGATNIATYIFRILNPAIGTNNIVITQSSGIAMICYDLSATDVNQTTPETDNDGICGTTDPETLTLTTATNELLLDVMGLAILGSNTPGTNQTEEIDLQEGSTTLTVTGSRKAGADGGVMSQDQSGANNHCYSAVSIGHQAYVASGRRSAPMVFR